MSSDGTVSMDAGAICAMCEGVLRRTYDLEAFSGREVHEGWRCEDCRLSGSVLRDGGTGRPLRLPHVMTGRGFVWTSKADRGD